MPVITFFKVSLISGVHRIKMGPHHEYSKRYSFIFYGIHFEQIDIVINID